MRPIGPSLLVLALLRAAPPALAAATPPDAAAPVATDTIEVTATLVQTDRREVAATVRRIEGDEVSARHVESILELLGTVAGAEAFSLGPPGQQASLFIRGANSNQTLMLWNGIALNDPFFGAYNFAFLSAEGVERVEVVAGPFSALYGSSAMGGVVQVLTAMPRGARIDLEAGELGRRRVSFAAGADAGPLHGELLGHRREGRGGFGNDAYDSRELSGRAQWTVTAQSDASLLARWNESETGIPFSGLTPAPHRSIAWRELVWGLPWSHTTQSWDLQGSLSQIRYDAAFRDPDDAFGFTREDTLSRADRARAVASRHLEGLGWWAAGADGELDTVTDRSRFGTNLEGRRQRTEAAFSQLHLEGARWAADLGLRHDANDSFGAATSPRVGVVLTASRSLRLRASFGESFRAPALGELDYPFFGNPALRPERGRTAEVGLNLQRGPWQLDVAAFDSRQRDLIVYDFAAAHDVNVGRATSRGVDAEVRLREGGLELRLGGMHLRAEDTATGKPLRNRPDDTAQLVASHRAGPALVSLAASWVGPRVNADPITGIDTHNGGFVTAEMAVSWQLPHGVAPYARVENALDRRYQPVLGFPAPGRVVVGGVRLAW